MIKACMTFLINRECEKVISRAEVFFLKDTNLFLLQPLIKEYKIERIV